TRPKNSTHVLYSPPFRPRSFGRPARRTCKGLAQCSKAPPPPRVEPVKYRRVGRRPGTRGRDAVGEGLPAAGCGGGGTNAGRTRGLWPAARPPRHSNGKG